MAVINCHALSETATNARITNARIILQNYRDENEKMRLLCIASEEESNQLDKMLVHLAWYAKLTGTHLINANGAVMKIPIKNKQKPAAFSTDDKTA